MASTRLLSVAALATTAVFAVTPIANAARPAAAHPGHRAAKHVLLLSVDGMHASDLSWFVRTHPDSTLARLSHRGTTYRRALTTFPSDSFPGMVAQFTGAGPGVAGVYYDDTYNHALLPAGTTDCATAKPGTEVPWTEAIDTSQSPITLDAGQGLKGGALAALPTNTLAQTLASAGQLTSEILAMTPNPQTVIDQAALPVDPATCKPLMPHQYLKVNTVFDVLHKAGMRTAWSDKHPAYEILNGPSGTGIDDLFTPEINSIADAAGDDWTTDNALTEEYDNFKVAAVLNEIGGFDHSGTQRVGTPAIYGMNFQTLSTAQKLPTSDGLAGGYQADGTPGPLVQRALGYVDDRIGAMVADLKATHQLDDTTIIVSAKHGQSPIDAAKLRRVDDGAIIDAVNAAWAKTHPGAAPLVSFSTDDDLMMWWLSDHSPAAEAFAKGYLMSNSAPANLAGDPKGTYSGTVEHSGLTSVLTGAQVDRFVGARIGDAHAPDLVGIAQVGVVYTGGVKKIAEHGGDSVDDRHVALLIAGPGTHGNTVAAPVQTMQIAPTILRLLGLSPRALEGVRIEHTRVLPAS